MLQKILCLPKQLNVFWGAFWNKYSFLLEENMFSVSPQESKMVWHLGTYILNKYLCNSLVYTLNKHWVGD